MFMYCTAIIVAAGIGKRFGSDLPKQFFELDNKPILSHTLDIFESMDIINEIIVVLDINYFEYFNTNVLNRFACKNETYKKVRVVEGGKERKDSVMNALKQLNDECEVVLIHDGVRPFVSKEIIYDVYCNTIKHGACIPCVGVTDTVKEIRGSFVVETKDRDSLVLVQTPQGFLKELIKNAYEAVEASSTGHNSNIVFTDDASYIEHTNGKVYVTRGSYRNIKITTKDDLLRR